jgi:hypothetical protein
MSRGLITQFTHHYPETLGFSVLMNIPWWMRCVINLAMPFFDTYTRSKFRTHDGAEAIAQGDLLASDLLDECGGELEVSLVVCLKSRRRKLGAKVGRSLSTQRHTKTQSSRFASSAAIRISRTDRPGGAPLEGGTNSPLRIASLLPLSSCIYISFHRQTSTIGAIHGPRWACMIV